MTTKADLYKLCDAINEARKYYGLSANYYIEYAYGRPRLERSEKADRTGGSFYVSPRLSPGEMGRWMEAYLAGMNAAHAEMVGY